MFKRVIFFIGLLNVGISNAHIFSVHILENKKTTQRVILFGDRHIKNEDWIPQSGFLKRFLDTLQKNGNRYDMLIEKYNNLSHESLRAWFCPAMVQLFLDYRTSISTSTYTFPLSSFVNTGSLEVIFSVGTWIIRSIKPVRIVYGSEQVITDVVALLTHKAIKESWKSILSTEKTDPDEWEDILLENV
ncbi:hypothetical protein K9K77_00480 [Candidatus Babeliales bacterium]|nr:hypothetical protein [Candidatus Babeliales bacterium]